MLDVKKKITSLAAREDTEKMKEEGWSLFDRKRNLARIISAEIHKVSAVKGMASGSVISLGCDRTN